VLDLETAELQCHLTTNNQEERAPAWSPDGAKIAYMCRRGGNDFEICVMKADRTGDLQLTDNTVLDASPKWSPDGQKILFHRLVAAGQQQLFVMNADGSDQTKLTDFAGTNLLAAWGKVRANCDKFWPPLPPVN
jgi:TolB protein